MKAAIAYNSEPVDLVKPGHMFPLVASAGVVLARKGHTEATVDLARLAGLKPYGLLCELMNADGTMSRLPEVVTFAEKHQMVVITIEDLVAYRLLHEKLLHRVAEARLPTQHGEFKAIAYESDIHPGEHLALVMGDVATPEPVLVRVDSECATGEVFGSVRCDCGEQLDMAMKKIAKAGRGVIIFLRQEGRGIGLHNKIRAYALQDKGMDTVEANIALGFPADMRDYEVGAQIVQDLEIKEIQLITNNPLKIESLAKQGVKVVARVPIVIPPNKDNQRYLATKKSKMGHLG